MASSHRPLVVSRELPWKWKVGAFWFGLGAVFVVPDAALAANGNRTICFSLGFYDNRNLCPGATGVPTTGARRQCHPGGTNAADHFEFVAYDADGSNPADDDYIATYTADANSVSQCFTFNWVDSEADPDVYIVVVPRVRGSVNGIPITAKQNVGSAGSPSWTTYASTTTRSFQAVDCGANQTCWLAGGNTMYPSLDVNADISLVWMALDSAQVALQTFDGAISGTAGIDLQIDNYSQLPTSQKCPNGCAPSQTVLRVPLDSGTDNSTNPPTFWGNVALDALTLPHEVGHVLHQREFGQNGLVGAGCSWGINTRTNQFCATIEGFASYVAMAGWWNPASGSGWYGIPLEEALPLQATCNNNIDIAGQVAKGFWDLDDSANEPAVSPGAGPDSKNFNSTALLNYWSKFPSGTGNRGAQETGGFNCWDYVWNAWNDGIGGWGTYQNFETLMYHNCLGGQTTD